MKHGLCLQGDDLLKQLVEEEDSKSASMISGRAIDFVNSQHDITITTIH